MATALQFNNSSVETPPERRAIRGLAGWFFATCWTIVLTGAVRKWIFPSINILYLLQDVPIACGYIYALWFGLFYKNLVMMCVLGLSALLIFQGLLQIIISGLSPVVAFIGVHNYIFYLPMLFIFPVCLTPKYQRDFIRFNLLLSLPMCALALVQSQSPTSAWVNRTTGGDAFSLPGTEIARVIGTFNFTVFYGIWVAIAVALCMGEWLLPLHRRTIQNKWLLISCTFAVNLCYLVSSSRIAMIQCVITILGALLAALMIGAVRPAVTILSILLVIPIGGVVTYIISPAGTSIVIERLTGSRYVDDGQSRVKEILVGFLITPKFDLVGAGIGMGVDAAHVGSADTYNFTYDLSEDDSVRNVMELGTIVGLVWVFSRLFFTLGIGMLATRMVRKGQLPHVLPMAFFVASQVFTGDMTRSATMTASQAMLASAFILGVYYHPENQKSLEHETDEFVTRYA